MLAQIPEKHMHQVRFVLAIGWLILIGSFLWEANPLLGSSKACLQDLAQCSWLYRTGPSLFWGMIVPFSIVILLVLGHEAWRRICPLAFMSQITSAFGLPSRSHIGEKSWLSRYHLYLQFGLFFVGLNCRILLIESDRTALGIFLILVILAAMAVVYFFGGRSWCHYFCPMSPVQTVFTGPRGLLGSEAHKAPPGGITQSMCRIWDLDTNHEKSICVGCKSPCSDIDAEYTYWQEIAKPGGRLIRYGYLGIVIGFFGYLYLYAGSWDSYYSSAWANHSNQFAQLLDPGLTIASIQSPLPKCIACPLVLGLSVWMTCLICTRLEKAYAAYLKRNNKYVSPAQVLHRFFSIVTLISFNIYLIFSGYPFLSQLPEVTSLIGVIFVTLSSSLWFYRTWNRSPDQYFKESVTDSLRRQLQKLPIDLAQILPGRPLDQLQSDEVYALAQVLPGLAKQYQFQVYRGVLEEALTAKRVEAFNCLEAFSLMRQRMGLNDEAHHAIVMNLCREKPDLFYPLHQLLPDEAHRPAARPSQKPNSEAKPAQETGNRQEADLADEQIKIEQPQPVNQTADEQTKIEQPQPVNQTADEQTKIEQPQPANQSADKPIKIEHSQQANQTEDDEPTYNRRSQRENMASEQTLIRNSRNDKVHSDDEPTEVYGNIKENLDDDECTKL